MLFVQGAAGSPYTCKMLAVLRYKRIPYRYIQRAQAPRLGLPRLGLPKPRVELLPTFYFPQDDGGYTAVVDSTPLIRRLEAASADHAVLPPDPVMAFFDALIEDYADEWLTKAMFHYRWHHIHDRNKAGLILPLQQNVSASQDQIDAMAANFTERQTRRLRYVGSNPITGPLIEAKCLAELRRLYAALGTPDTAGVTAHCAGTGVEQLFQVSAP